MIWLWKRPMCILCRKYFAVNNMHFVHRNIGICNHCYDALQKTKDNTHEGKHPVEMVISPFVYTGDLREAVKRFKFSGQYMYGSVFGEMIWDRIKESNLLDGFDLIVPVPLHTKRYLERGYNQAEVVAKVLSDKSQIPMNADALVRVKETQRQSSLKGLDRVNNVHNAFYAKPELADGKNIIVVDDIYTAGETVKECAVALKCAGAKKIVALTLCKTDYKEFSLYNTEIPHISK